MRKKPLKSYSRAPLILAGFIAGVMLTSVFFGIMNSSKPRQPDSRPVQTLLGEAANAFYAKNYERAMQLYKDVLAKDPDNYDANKFLGSILIGHSDPKNSELALQYISKAVSLKEDYEESGFYGSILWETHRYQESEKIFRKLLQQNPKDVHALEYLGYSLKDQGRKKEALVIFKQAIKLEPERSSVQAAIDWIKENPL